MLLSLIHIKQNLISLAIQELRHKSSYFGVGSEDAETVAAGHVDMCKFNSANDVGYRSLITCIAKYIQAEEIRVRLSSCSPDRNILANKLLYSDIP
jgi:hypothetical protein